MQNVKASVLGCLIVVLVTGILGWGASEAHAQSSLVWVDSAFGDPNAPFGLGALQKVVLSPDQKFLYALGSLATVTIFQVEPTTGHLILQGWDQPNVAFDLMSLAISPNGKNLYAVGSFAGTLTWTRNVTDGSLSFVGNQTSDPFFATTSPNALAFSSDGQNVYLGRGTVGSLAVFDRDLVTGALTALEVHDPNGPAGIQTPSAVVLSSDDAFVYVADGVRVVVFSRNPSTGQLSFSQASPPRLLGVITAIALSPDGQHLYAARTAGIDIFQRNPATGTVSFVSAIENGGIWGGPSNEWLPDIQVSADGTRVFAASNFKGLLVFKRDETSGGLTFQESHVSTLADPLHGVPNFDAPRSVAVRSDGAAVYVAAQGLEEALAHFRSLPQCASLPRSGCRQSIQAHRGTVLLKKNTDSSRDKLIFKWIKGEATPTSAFGDPLDITDYLLCAYDESGGIPSLILNSAAPAGGTCSGKPCWKGLGKPSGSKGFKYKTRENLPDGIRTILLKPGDSGKARLILKGKGSLLNMPALPLLQDPSVIFQVINRDDECWEARFSGPPIKNDSIQFKAKSD